MYARADCEVQLKRLSLGLVPSGSGNGLAKTVSYLLKRVILRWVRPGRGGGAYFGFMNSVFMHAPCHAMSLVASAVLS